MMKMIKANPVMVFSKSYCPHCANAKKALAEKEIAFNSIEMDLTEGGDQMKAELEKMTDHGTVPYVFAGQKFIGGNTQLQSAIVSGEL